MNLQMKILFIGLPQEIQDEEKDDSNTSSNSNFFAMMNVATKLSRFSTRAKK